MRVAIQLLVFTSRICKFDMWLERRCEDILDLLEESDDEEEFENISLDKFVDLDKKIIMECVFIKKFDSWQPIKISKNKISPRREIICYKK